MTPMAMLLSRAVREPGRVALRHLHLGVWREITWREYATAAGVVAGALRERGIGRGDRVALAVGHRPEWLFAELGIGLAGAVSVGLDLDLSVGELAEVLAATGARVLFAADEEQLDKALRACPELACVVVLDPRCALPEDPRVVRFADFRGAAVTEVAADADDVATVLPVAYTHRTLTGAAAAASTALGLHAGDELLSHAPCDDLRERLFSTVHHLHCGYVVNLGGGPESVRDDLVAVQPTVLYAPSTVWRDLRLTSESRLSTASTLKRWVSGRAGLTGGAVPRLPLAGPLVYRPLRARIGLRRLRVALGEADCADTSRWFARIGVELTTYDVTEPLELTEEARP